MPRANYRPMAYVVTDRRSGCRGHALMEVPGQGLVEALNHPQILKQAFVDEVDD